MGKWFLQYQGSDKEIELDDVQVLRTRLTDLKFGHDGFKYRFQYDRANEHERALRGEWVRGYEIYKIFTRDVFVRYVEESNI
jgi:hypothetical protein